MFRVVNTRIGSLALAVALGAVGAVGGAPPAGAHGGGLDSNGGHHCREAGYESGKCAPLGSYHCHQSPCGETTETTAPPETAPPTTSPPATSPPTTKAPSSDGTTATTKPRSFASTTTTTSAPDAAPAAISVAQPQRDSPELVVEIEGEPGAAYEVTVQSRPQTASGVLDASGQAQARFLVENGEHTVTVVLEDEAGNALEPIVESVTVDVPAPLRPSARFSEAGGPPHVVIDDAPPFGDVTVTSDGGGRWSDRVDESGSAAVVLDDIGDGEHELTVVAADHQGQEAEPVVLSGVAIGSEQDDAGTGESFATLAVLAALGAGGFWLWRRRRTDTAELSVATGAPARALPPPPPPSGVAPPPPPVPLGSDPPPPPPPRSDP